jgi:hypothetical protein
MNGCAQTVGAAADAATKAEPRPSGQYPTPALFGLTPASASPSHFRARFPSGIGLFGVRSGLLRRACLGTPPAAVPLKRPNMKDGVHECNI